MTTSQEKLLLVKLAELQARKQRVEQLVGLLGAMRLQDEEAAATAAAGASGPKMADYNSEPTTGVTKEDSPRVVSRTEVGDFGIGFSAEATRDGGSNPGELVQDDEAVGMAELQQKLRYVVATIL